MKVSQHAMHQPITGLVSNAIPAYNAVKRLPVKEPAEAQKDRERADLSGSFSTKSNWRLLWLLSPNYCKTSEHLELRAAAEPDTGYLSLRQDNRQ